MKNTKFYICSHCGNIAEKINDSGVPMVCCGKRMDEIIPGVVEASHEKHIPVVSREGNVITVTVGSVIHPMSEEHSIEWIYLETDKGAHRRALTPGEEPVVKFVVDGETPIAVYAYCNLHGLWKTEI